LYPEHFSSVSPHASQYLFEVEGEVEVEVEGEVEVEVEGEVEGEVEIGRRTKDNSRKEWL